jgi:hypothetical protein
MVLVALEETIFITTKSNRKNMFWEKRPIDCLICTSTFAGIGITMAASAVVTLAVTAGIVGISALTILAATFAVPAVITGLIFSPLFILCGPTGKDYQYKSFLYQTIVFAMTCIGVSLAACFAGLFTLPLLATFLGASAIVTVLLSLATLAANCAFKGSTTPVQSISDVYEYVTEKKSDKVD